MVMKAKVLSKNLFRSIRRSLTRYIAIVAIIALGAGIFVGLRTTKSDMVATGQKYMDSQNMFDLRLLSPYGWTKEQLAEIGSMSGVAAAEGVVSVDVLGTLGDEDRSGVYKLYSMPDKLSRPYLLSGRMPQAADECLVDGSHVTDAILGKRFTLAAENEEDTLEMLKSQSFTVVGRVASPLYMDISRGSTTLGNGTVQAFLYVPAESFDTDYYTEIDISLTGEYAVYTPVFDDAMDDMAERLKVDLKPLALHRFEEVRSTGEAEYADGLAEYQKGLEDYQNGKAEAEEQLAAGEQELLDGEKTLADQKALLEAGETELQAAEKLLADSAAQLGEGRTQLAQGKAEAYAQLAQANGELLENYKTVSDNLKQVNDGLLQIESGLGQLDTGISQLESGLQQLGTALQLVQALNRSLGPALDAARSALDAAKEQGVDAETIARLEAELERLTQKQQEYIQKEQELLDDQKTYTQQLEQLQAQRQELAAQKETLTAAKSELDTAMAAIDTGFLELQNSRTELENQFAAAQAEIETGTVQLEAGQRELEAKRKELEAGKLALADGETQLQEARQTYEEEKEKALAELADAQAELDSALEELNEARHTLDTLEAPQVYALTRNTNVGYLALDNNSDIVEGVSAVFPAFFLLIAALVCITTMTRMVEEERTQIGTMKALGYTDGEVISKYLIYAGSAAILGCGLGVVVGSIVFPVILWRAYGLILTLPQRELVLHLNWGLCAAVVAMYTAVTLAVTYYCCHRSLREVPAELIRPRPPTNGKKIFMEYLPFWKNIRFLNKVMLRNTVRYRQRLLMMLVGIGGCTALLLTAFGIRDSISDIAVNQFSEVSQYDMEVRFTDSMDEAAQERFRQEYGTSTLSFFHQSSGQMDYNGQSREITFLAAGSDLEQHLDFHHGKEPLAMPQAGEALISAGTAEEMGVRAGDTVTFRSGDMKALTLKISGVFDNYVYNYLITTPDTAAQQWGEQPQVQMAYVKVAQGQDVHEIAKQLMGAKGVMNVTVCQDLEEQVDNMMNAMDLVVVTVLICAGLLAVIVLYNLTNININERIREIATIKVLGFYAHESAAYVFKENLLLSAVGSLLGLAGGYGLLKFVMSQIRVNMVWLPARLLPVSYVLSIVLTMLIACLVDFVLYFKLEKINMAEALKSVE